MATSTSTPHVERESALSPFPSIVRLVAALTFISIGCVGWHFGSTIITPLSFSAATWLFTSHAEWHRRLTARDYLLLVAVFALFAVFIVVTHGKQFPSFDQFFQHPTFLTALWLVLCSLYIRRWRILRRTPRANSNETGNA